MIPTTIYISSESPKSMALKEDAHLIALQKGCDPEVVHWPEPATESVAKAPELENELQFHQKQFRELIKGCDLFVAIVDHEYGKLRVKSPHVNDPISPMHYEILEVSTMQHRPEVLVFSWAMEKEPAVQRMLSAVNSRIIDFDTENEFRTIFSKKLTEFRQGLLAARGKSPVEPSTGIP